MDIKEYVARETGCGFYLADAREISTFKGGRKAWIFQPESTENLIEIVLFHINGLTGTGLQAHAAIGTSGFVDGRFTVFYADRCRRTFILAVRTSCAILTVDLQCMIKCLFHHFRNFKTYLRYVVIVTLVPTFTVDSIFYRSQFFSYWVIPSRHRIPFPGLRAKRSRSLPA